MNRTLRCLLTACFTMMMIAATTAGAQTPAPIAYTIRFPAPATHYMEIEAVYPTGGRAEIDLFMAVWTPGSYLVREYARHVEQVVARGAAGQALAVRKTTKNRWRVATGGAASVTVRYRVYGREMTVRNNWIEAGFAMLNGAPTFLTLVDDGPRAHRVRLELPEGWTTTATALTRVEGEAHSYVAEDFDTLVDSPIVAGNPVITEFAFGGRPHYVVHEGDPSLWDTARANDDVRKIVEVTREMFGEVPYPHYYFLNMVTEAGGGLEHKNSTLLMANRFTTRARRSYLGWLTLVSHEYFHVWNVKRLRPVALGPFDYEHENYTESLWVAEGVTSYFGDLLVRRAGLSTRGEYLEGLSTEIANLQNAPGRAVQTTAASSFDTWIKQYRPDENSPNTAISYYTSGQVISFLLDAKIRAATNGQRSLDDGMRLAYQRYSGPTGYTPDEFHAVMSEVAGVDLAPWFARVLTTTEEFDYTEALHWYGLRFRPAEPTTRAWTGLVTRNDAGRLLVSQVRRDTPGYAAGLNVDDEILAIDDLRVRADQLTNRLEQYKAGDQVTLLVARRERLMRLVLTFGAEPGRAWRLEPDPGATEEQRKRLAAWLGD
ncbi:MAG: PDZ domain-containing protein [Vicinamibacterales bacterium]|nr:PDZ domain-containing protein [Vicinamibacterales bacterium]